ncbi:MAG TPA: hypothetical protein VG939_07890 [Caulobacteraceae bacterium]|nr:hypothetical protein [Caulobacteraceae bacterium]
MEKREPGVDAENQAWKTIAISQGLVCLVCGEPPALKRRDVFYDSGLCRRCAAELDAAGDE